MKITKHLFVFIFTLVALNAAAQKKYDRESKLTEFNDLLISVSASINDIPFAARRVALFDITSRSDNPVIISQKQLRLQFEDVLKKKAFTVVSVPEFERKMIMKINGNDSLIKIDNQSAISNFRQQPESLAELCRKYGIQSLIDCNLFFDSVNGFVMNIRFVNASTREVLWNETLYSRVKESTFKVRKRINFGAGLTVINSFQENTTVYSSNTITTSFLAEYTYDQNMSADNTAFFGLFARLNYYNLRLATSAVSENNKLGSAFFPGVGIRGSKLFYKKKQTQGYWFEYQLGGGVTIYNKLFGQVNQAMNISLTKNFGIGMMMEYNLIAPKYSKGVTSVSFNNINYAFSLAYKF